MAKLDLTDEEADMLRDFLDIHEEQWKDTREVMETEPIDSWEELLDLSATASKAISLLRKIRDQLNA